MRRRTVVGVLIAVGALVVLLGGYGYSQYRSATPPALGGIPIYSHEADVPLSDVPGPAAAEAEQTLRKFAAGVIEGRRVAGERFLATDGPLTWDAVRHSVGSSLHNYSLQVDGTSSDGTVEYLLYRRGNPVRRWFNDDAVLVAAVTGPSGHTSSGRDIRVYGYFRLAA